MAADAGRDGDADAGGRAGPRARISSMIWAPARAGFRIAAAKEFGARAVGIEYDAALVALARRNAQRAGVADRVEIVEGDIFNQDFSAATVVTLYLLPELNAQLRPRILRLKPGTRVVSHLWDMGEWEADESFRVADSAAYLWVVPADVAGHWTLRERGWIPRRRHRGPAAVPARRRNADDARPDAAAAGRLCPGRNPGLHVRPSRRRRAKRARPGGRQYTGGLPALRRHADIAHRPTPLTRTPATLDHDHRKPP